MSNCWSMVSTARWLQMTTVIYGVMLGLVTISTPVMAESTAEALRAFGLVGTWSPDCAADGNSIFYARVTFAASTLDAPTMSMVIIDNRSFLSQIVSAVRVTEDKIKISTKSISHTQDGVEYPSAGATAPAVMVIRKVGSKLFGPVTRDGQDSELEKCLN